MIAKIAAFEIKYQLKNPVFWVGVFIFFMLGFGFTASDNVSLGTPGITKENGALPILQLTAFSTLFYLFILTAFVANAIVRDDASGYAPILRSAPIGKSDLLFGRFIGAFAIALIGYLAIPLGLFVGSLMWWVDPETVGPQVFSYYAWPFLIFAIPNLFFLSALLFVVSTLTRSLMWSYVAVIALLMFYLGFEVISGNNPEAQQAYAKFDPFGSNAIVLETRYWTGSENNTRLIALAGDILFNRLFVIGLGIVLLAVAWRFFSMSARPVSKRRMKKLAKRDAKQAKLAAIEPTLGGEAISTRGRPISRWAQLKARTRVEFVQMLRSPGLVILALLAVMFTAVNVWGTTGAYGNDSYATTAATIDLVRGNFSLFTLIIAAFYGGELVWRERDNKLNDIIDSAPVPSWIMTVPKMLAIFLVLVAVNLLGMLTGIVYQLVEGAVSIDVGSYLAWYIVPAALDGLLFAVLAVLLQILAPNKYAGWGLLLAWFLLNTLITTLGFAHPLYRFASTGYLPLSGMVDTVHFLTGPAVMYGYWLLFAFLMMIVAHLLWPRGGDLALRSRFRRLKRGGIPRVPAMLMVAAVAGMIGLGSYAFHNMNVLNTYRTSDQDEARMATYERKYLKYENVAQPVVTDVTFAADLYPDERRMMTEGRYTLRNDTDAPIETLHVRQFSESLDYLQLAVAGAELESHDEEFGYRIFRFTTPLAPGAETTLNWKNRLWYRGFGAGGAAQGLNPDTTFVNNSTFAPIIGMDRTGLLSDRTVRRRQGLSDELRPLKIDDPRGQERNYIGADWVTSDITLTTKASHTPIAPGERVSDTVEGDRRTARFVAGAPILNFFSLQSADYEIARRQMGDIGLEVYYQEGHDWNVERMLDAMEASLSYYEENFGPYQFDYARIVEFPFGSFAQAFAGTMPYAEGIGFRARLDDPEAVDFVTYVIAHELAHQYWAHQALGGYQQGSTMTTETLASYSAIMVMKDLLGEDALRRFLKYELDGYLRARKGDVIGEQPLKTVENQGYVHYQKGALAFHRLAEQMGEDKVNAALASYLSEYRFEGAPYPRSTDIIDELRRVASGPEEQQLITDMLERIVLYDLKVADSETRKVGNEWVTTMTVEGARYEADGKGKETRIPLDESVKIGLFTERPGFGSFDRRDVLVMRDVTVGDGKSRFELRSKQRPSYVGVDPYNFLIDRNSDDNVKAVSDD